MTTITSTKTGNWNSGGTWIGGVVPVSGNSVVIDAGHTVTIDTLVTGISSIVVNGTLSLPNGNDLGLDVAGNISGTGSFNIGTVGNPLYTPILGNTYTPNVSFSATSTITVPTTITPKLQGGTITEDLVTLYKGNSTLKFSCTSSNPVYKDYYIWLPKNKNLHYEIKVYKSDPNGVIELQIIDPTSDPLNNNLNTPLSSVQLIEDVEDEWALLDVDYKPLISQQGIVRIYTQCDTTLDVYVYVERLEKSL